MGTLWAGVVPGGSRGLGGPGCSEVASRGPQEAGGVTGPGTLQRCHCSTMVGRGLCHEEAGAVLWGAVLWGDVPRSARAVGSSALGGPWRGGGTFRGDFAPRGPHWAQGGSDRRRQLGRAVLVGRGLRLRGGSPIPPPWRYAIPTHDRRQLDPAGVRGVRCPTPPGGAAVVSLRGGGDGPPRSPRAVSQPVAVGSRLRSKFPAWRRRARSLPAP